MTQFVEKGEILLLQSILYSQISKKIVYQFYLLILDLDKSSDVRLEMKYNSSTKKKRLFMDEAITETSKQISQKKNIKHQN